MRRAGRLRRTGLSDVYHQPPSSLRLAAGADTNALRDIKPPVEIPSGWAWVCGGRWWCWRSRRWRSGRGATGRSGARKSQIVPVIPPHVRAKQKLREALALIGQPREFCILGLRHDPLVSGGAVRLPCARAHDRGVPLRIAGHQPADAGPEGQPGRIPQALRPGQVRQIRARPA